MANKKHVEEIRSISSDAWSNFPEQITIDLIQQAEKLLLCDSDKDMRDEVGAHCYKVRCVLDIYNPKYEHDIKLLKRLKSALDDWVNAIETANRALGYPVEGK